MRLFLALLFLAASYAQADFKVPELTGPVMDQAGMLSSESRSTLTQFFKSVYEQGGPQVQVLTLQSLDGLTVEEASIQIVDKWKLGKVKDDRGVLLLLAQAEHKIRIEVGRGLEGDLPDVIAHRIITEEISPLMKQGDSNAAILTGVREIMKYAAPQFLESNPEVNRYEAPHRHMKLSLIIKIGFWILIFIFFLFPTNRRRRFWGGGYYGGGFGGGGFGGGGFGGGGGWSGGGGGFSGGGSSGGW